MRDAPATPGAIEIGREGTTLGGATGDGVTLYAALNNVANSEVSAGRFVGAPFGRSLRQQYAGTCATLVRTGPLLVFAVGGTLTAARGEPGAVAIAVAADGSAEQWRRPIESTDWVVVSALAAAGDGGTVVGGSFSGTLRIGARVVSSGGKSDGFVARLTVTGEVAWLVRVGGPGADAVQGVAVAGDRVAIAGTFAAGADLLGQPLQPFDDRSPYADAFVAELDGAGGKRWAQTFGGKLDDAVAGVAIDAHGRVAVAATARETVHVNGMDLVAQGTADGLVAWWSPGGAAGAAVLLGGADFDGLRAIAAVGDRIVVAGFYSGKVELGDRTLAAGGGDDAFVASLDESGRVVESWQMGGEGREEVTSLSAIPGGFVAGVAHTGAALLDGSALPAPADPLSGAALIVRAVR